MDMGISMLRIIDRQTEAQTELKRIGDRNNGDDMQPKEAVVREIVTNVKQNGDRALLEYTEKFDRQSYRADQLRVSGSELDAAYQQISKDLLRAIQVARHKIEAFHRQRVPKSWVQFEEDDVVLGKRYTPVDRAGLYVPGGEGILS